MSKEQKSEKDSPGITSSVDSFVTYIKQHPKRFLVALAVLVLVV